MSPAAPPRPRGLRGLRAARAAKWEAPQGERIARRRRVGAFLARAAFVAAVAAALATVIGRQTAAVDRQRELARVRAELSVAEAERVEWTDRVQGLQSRARIVRVGLERLRLRVARDDEVVMLAVPAAVLADEGER